VDLVRGQKFKLADVGLDSRLSIGLRIAGPALEYDLSVFGLIDGKLEDDRYFVFFNNKQSPEGAIAMRTRSGDEQLFDLDVSKLPAKVTRLVFTATVDQGDFSLISSGHWRVLDANNRELAVFKFGGADFQRERAVMVAEVYLKDVWRASAVGQGFNGGLSALVEHFGGTVSAPVPAAQPIPQPAPAPAPIPVPASAARATPSPAPQPTPSPAPQPAPQPNPSVSLTKVTLEKRGQEARISLRKDGQAQPIHVNLNWNQQAQRKGILGRIVGGGSADLDLGCMYFLNDGSGGVIQALGNSFGSDRFEPFIFLDKDDRSGAASDGENLYILRPDLIHTVLLFAFIYEGTSDFTHVAGRLSMTDPAGNEININLSNPDMRRTFCAIAQIENIGGDIKITKEERYFQGHRECDEHYGFGFNWGAGSK
jgi:tellurite resistance protein TerA